jgi:hypothetical protein
MAIGDRTAIRKSRAIAVQLSAPPRRAAIKTRIHIPITGGNNAA